MKDQSPVTDQLAHASGWSIYWHQLWRPTAAENFESIRKGCQSNNHPIAGQVAGYSLGLVGGIATLFAGKLLAAPLGSARDFFTRKSLARLILIMSKASLITIHINHCRINIKSSSINAQDFKKILRFPHAAFELQS